jgi:hypothetical protein
VPCMRQPQDSLVTSRSLVDRVHESRMPWPNAPGGAMRSRNSERLPGSRGCPNPRCRNGVWLTASWGNTCQPNRLLERESSREAALDCCPGGSGIDS